MKMKKDEDEESERGKKVELVRVEMQRVARQVAASQNRSVRCVNVKTLSFMFPSFIMNMDFQMDPNCNSSSNISNVNVNNGNNNKSDENNCVTGVLPCLPTLGSELFYSHSPAGFDFPGGIEAWRSSSFVRTRPSMYCDYAMFRGIDFNGSRRKNATRETTSTLKAWLNEHRKNPYPTKAEKIMLAIMTQMTLTQVSTWFANARRRLKKENKMTWSPRNRCDEDEIIETPFSENHRSTTSSSPSSALSSSSSANNSTVNQPHPIIPNPIIQKPKIWSIVDTATSDSV